MIVALLIYAGVYTLSRKVLPWVATRHPGARNTAAFIVESFAAIGAANAISLIAAAWHPNLHPDAPALNVLLAGTFALGMHYLASDIATSVHPIYLPFLVGSIVFMLVPRSMAHATAFGMLLAGTTATIFKQHELRRAGSTPVEAARR